VKAPASRGAWCLSVPLILGWEPASTSEVYPRLDDDSLMSVIGEWKRVGDLLIANTVDKWENPALLIFTEASLINQFATSVG